MRFRYCVSTVVLPVSFNNASAITAPILCIGTERRGARRLWRRYAPADAQCWGRYFLLSYIVIYCFLYVAIIYMILTACICLQSSSFFADRARKSYLLLSRSHRRQTLTPDWRISDFNRFMLLLLKTTVSVINGCRRSLLSRLTWLSTPVSSAKTFRLTILCDDEMLMFASRTHWVETIRTYRPTWESRLKAALPLGI